MTTRRYIGLWSEGYQATGGSRGAYFHGTFYAKDLKEAVIKYRKTVHPEDLHYIDVDKLTVWGCRFFTDESQARVSFG
jgi:hypothetical protein